MEIELSKVILTVILTAIVGSITWIVRTVNETKNKQDQHEIKITNLEQKNMSLPDRITRLETVVEYSVKELRRGIGRIEGYISRKERGHLRDNEDEEKTG